MEGSTGLNLKEEAKENIQLSSLQVEPQAPVKYLVLVAAIAVGLQFGWALQLSLLTPYVQLLGIPHKLAPIIWLCGPISGMLVPPLVGYYSDNCTSRFGRRQPFIAAGAALVVVAAFLISFATDVGHKYGDRLGKGDIKPRAIVVFATGFATLDIANNMLACPCRALLADLSGGDAKKTRMSNAGFSFFIAIGNLLGYAAGSYKNMYHIFPFTKTTACDIYCANLKSCFFISIFLLITLTILALTLVHEKPFSIDEHNNDNKSSRLPFFLQLFSAIKHSSKPMRILLLVTCFNWIGWFPFFLFDTDWTGREVYGGKVGTSLYDQGVHVGALGLLLNSVVLGFSSLVLEYLGNKMGGVNRLWGVVNFLLAICLGMTVPVSKLADSTRRADGKPAAGVKVAALAIFCLMGIPLSVTFSIPPALASIFANDSGLGQGLSLAVLNLSVVIPQMVISLVSGQWDELFGGGNLPAFVVGAIAAALSGIFAITLLPFD